jgi:hypothetical protein
MDWHWIDLSQKRGNCVDLVGGRMIKKVVRNASKILGSLEPVSLTSQERLCYMELLSGYLRGTR